MLIPITIRTFAVLIVNAETVMIIATKAGTAVSVQQVKAARKGLIAAMAKEACGCAVKEGANLVHCLRWP